MAETDNFPMKNGSWQFGPFTLDVSARELARNGEEVALGARYFDALVLLLEANGAVVSKDRFIAEAWQGVPVTDEALTQGIRALRKALGDDAAKPTFIQTVPRHGYRFVGKTIKVPDGTKKKESRAAPAGSGRIAILATFGGALAGLLIGTTYGTFAAAPASGNVLSALLVLSLAGVLSGAVAAGGIGLGLVIAQRLLGSSVFADFFCAVIGGGAIGMVGRMMTLDGFALFVGAGPVAMTGPIEGAFMGAVIAVGLALWREKDSLQLAVAIAVILGGLAAAAIALAGGRFFAGSLFGLLTNFTDSRLSFEPLANLLEEPVFGTVSNAATAMFEGSLFCGFVTAFVAAKRSVGLVNSAARRVV